MTRHIAAFAVAFLLIAGSLPAFADGNESHHPEGEPRHCGGIAGLTCEHENEFCKMKPGTCQVADNMGVCMAKPEGCTKEYRPVCGCDGQTYGNKCMAMAAGVSIDHKGACEGDGAENTGHHPDDHHDTH